MCNKCCSLSKNNLKIKGNICITKFTPFCYALLCLLNYETFPAFCDSAPARGSIFSGLTYSIHRRVLLLSLLLVLVTSRIIISNCMVAGLQFNQSDSYKCIFMLADVNYVLVVEPSLPSEYS